MPALRGAAELLHAIAGLAALLVAAATAAETKVSKYDTMPQALVPAGEFTMGAEDADAHGRTAEAPPHKVVLDAFWMDQHEVTNEQYVRFLNSRTALSHADIYNYADIGNPVCRIKYDGQAQRCRVEPSYERHPVLAVSWRGASEYARFVRRRLPTEAEWEKAARGPDGLRYPWGNTWDPKKTNTREAGPGHALPVGSVAADRSAYGVLDLAGNAAEWVQDSWDESFYQTSPVRNPVNDQGAGQRYVVRGGAYCLTEWDARATSRQFLYSGAQRRYLGFRCAESVPPPLPPAAKVSERVLFYAAFDGHLHADAAKGERHPLHAPKDVGFVAGRRGQAAVLGDAAADRRWWVTFDTEGNFRLDEGTLSLWIQPRGWKGDDYGMRYFFMMRDETACKFYLYRFASGDSLLALAGNGIEGQWGTVGAKTTTWQDGQWVHLAVTWKDRRVTLYVDGQPAGATVVPPERFFRGLAPAFSLGQSENWSPNAKKAHTAFDEFVIFSRALSADEIVRERDRSGLP